MNTEFDRSQRIDRAFLRVALIMQGMWEEKGSSDTRLMLPPLIPDDYVHVGNSLLGKEYREHVVPRVAICHVCHAMFAQGESPADVSQVIRRNLKIVRISHSEREMLDSKKKLGLKQTMPEGWCPRTGDPFLRLKLAGIAYELFE